MFSKNNFSKKGIITNFVRYLGARYLEWSLYVRSIQPWIVQVYKACTSVEIYMKKCKWNLNKEQQKIEAEIKECEEITKEAKSIIEKFDSLSEIEPLDEQLVRNIREIRNCLSMASYYEMVDHLQKLNESMNAGASENVQNVLAEYQELKQISIEANKGNCTNFREKLIDPLVTSWSNAIRFGF